MPRFFCDRDVLKLARWLRFAGFDVMTRQELSEAKVAYICQKDRRVFITRNKKTRKHTTRVEILSSDDVKEQLRYILTKYKMDEDKIASRCMECNVLLRQVVDDEEKKYCPRCGKYFWKGSHYESMVSVIRLQ